MIKSEAKKKIEASATITNTMIVVIVVSRRVGQVTLAVSERTSCKNLNGLKAIALDPGPSPDELLECCLEIRTGFVRPELFGPALARDEPASGLEKFGNFQCRAGN